MSRLRANPALAAAAILGLAAALQRILLWLVYAPISYGDTGSYFRSAAVLASLTLNGYDGTRVPGYPAFVALAGVNPERVFAAQLVLGWLITMLLYFLSWRASRRVGLAVIVACFYTLVPGLFLFEANLLTETLTAFLLVLAFCLLVPLEQGSAPWARLGSAFALGLTAGAVGLVRILFYPLAVWLTPFVWAAGGSGKVRLVRTAVFLVPALALLLGWSAYIDRAYGFLAPTTMGGYNLVQHTGVFFQYLPDEDAIIRDTYLKYREARIAERGDQTNTIWEAIPELTQASGLGFYDLSREMQRLSLKLIREHPVLYLRNVVEGWFAFWKAPVYWEPTKMTPLLLAVPMRLWATVGRGITLLANIAFLGLSLWIVTHFRRYHDLLRDRLWLAPWGFVWFTSFVQTIADHGDNPRFLVPLQAIVFFVVVLGADSVYRKERN